jgi:carbonic anhydrase
MVSTCQTCIVTCMDFRLHRRADGRDAIGTFVDSLGVDCDIIARAGAVQDIVRPAPEGENTLLRDIGLSIALRQTKTIYLVNHENCGAYNGHNLPDPAAECAMHYDDLETACEILHQKFADVEVIPVLARLVPGSDDDFVIEIDS